MATGIGVNGMEFVVDGSPEQCVAALWEYFVHGEWPYKGTVHRGDNNISFVEPAPGMVSVLWRDAKAVQISAVAEGEGRTRLYVIPGRRKYADTLVKWIQKELVENKAATLLPSAGTPNQEAAGPDIPEQIRKLAELRDSGLITEEEFEAKKTDLLDRM